VDLNENKWDKHKHSGLLIMFKYGAYMHIIYILVKDMYNDVQCKVSKFPGHLQR